MYRDLVPLYEYHYVKKEDELRIHSSKVNMHYFKHRTLVMVVMLS